MMETIQLTFSQIKSIVRNEPGLYEIFTNDQVPLKVGIAKNLRQRLSAHGKSKQRALKLKVMEVGYAIGNVKSKSSVLSMHLYFDSSITEKYDLTTESGRVAFLENECYIQIQYTPTRIAARKLEQAKEASGIYRYVGRVLLR